MITACHSCRRGRGEHCLTCRRVEQDDIRIAHSPHNRDELTASAPSAGSGQCTDLPGETEDRFRQSLMALFDLSPIELLLVQHVMRGRTFASFGDVLGKVADKAAKYRGSPRAQAKAMSLAIRRKVPELRSVIAGREERFEELDGTIPLGDLFEFAGVEVHAKTAIAQDARKRPCKPSAQKATDEPTETHGRATGQGRRLGGGMAGVGTPGRS